MEMQSSSTSMKSRIKCIFFVFLFSDHVQKAILLETVKNELEGEIYIQKKKKCEMNPRYREEFILLKAHLCLACVWTVNISDMRKFALTL